MNIKSNFRIVSVVLLIMAFGTGCKKDKTAIPPLASHFNSTSGTVFLTAPGVEYKIPVGITTVSTTDVTVNISVSSPTGAEEGTQYTLSSKTITIPAGQTVDSLVVSGVYDQYTSGRKDTLIFAIQNVKDLVSAAFNDTFKLTLRGACLESDPIDLDELIGDYANTNEDFGGSPYGPYTTSILSVTKISPTSGTIKVANIFDAGWNPITFTLDWSDPASHTVTLVEQSGIGPGSSVGYPGEDISVRPFGGETGTFLACKQTLTLTMQVGITGLGYFPDQYTVNMAR